MYVYHPSPLPSLSSCTARTAYRVCDVWMVYGVWLMVHGILSTASTVYGLLYIAGCVHAFVLQCIVLCADPVFVSYILFTGDAHVNHRTVNPCNVLCCTVLILLTPSVGVACGIHVPWWPPSSSRPPPSPPTPPTPTQVVALRCARSSSYGTQQHLPPPFPLNPSRNSYICNK